MQEALFLSLIWQVSVGLSLSSLGIMSLLLVRRLITAKKENRRKDEQAKVRKTILSLLASPDLSRLKEEVKDPLLRRHLAFVGAELLRRLRGEDAELLTAILEGAGCLKTYENYAKKGDTILRLAAINVLERFQEEAADKILRKLLYDKDPAVRYKAASACENRGTLPPAKELTSILKFNETRMIHPLREFFRTLTKKSISTIIDILNLNPSETVHFAALEALGKCGNYNVIATLIHYSEDRRIKVRIAAINALSGLDHPQSIKAIQKSMQEDPHPLVRKAAQTAYEHLLRNNLTPGTGEKPLQADGWWQLFEWSEQQQFEERINRIKANKPTKDEAQQRQDAA